jgi:hypothetical protein
MLFAVVAFEAEVTGIEPMPANPATMAVAVVGVALIAVIANVVVLNTVGARSASGGSPAMFLARVAHSACFFPP